MNGLTGQLPEWMRSPAALIAGGLILLFLLVLVLRRRSDAAGYGLPSGRGWRGRVPLPSQASSLERMRAALEASGRSEPVRSSLPSPSALDDVPAAIVVQAEVKPASEAMTSKEEGPGEGAPVSDVEGAHPDAPAPDEDATASATDSAKVVPLHSGTPSSPDEAVGADEEAFSSHDHAVGAHHQAVSVSSRKRARKRKG